MTIFTLFKSAAYAVTSYKLAVLQSRQKLSDITDAKSMASTFVEDSIRIK